ncbi:hypothetical protein ACHAQA_006255 [Verticillium albo-atrum]
MKSSNALMILGSALVLAAPSPQWARSTDPTFNETNSPEDIQRLYDALAKRDGTELEKRNPASIAIRFIEYVFDLIGLLDDSPDPWDPKSGNCVMEVKSKNGGNCFASASPAGDPAFTEMTDWNVCFLNGQQYFTYPDAPGRASVGDVMIEFTAAGGVDGFPGDGLRNPRVSFNSLNPPVYMNFWERKSIYQDHEVFNLLTSAFETVTGSYNNRDPICEFRGDLKEQTIPGNGRGWDSYRCAVPCRDSGDWSH